MSDTTRSNEPESDHIEGVGGAAYGHAHTTPSEEDRNATVEEPEQHDEPQPESKTTIKKASSS